MASDLPMEPNSWRLAADLHLDPTSSLHDHVHKSGSNVDMEQFLLLRTIWPESRNAVQFVADNKAAGWISGVAEARARLSKLDSWARYCQSLDPKANIRSKAHQGTFALTRYYQYLTIGKTDGSGGFDKYSQPKAYFTDRVTRSQTRAQKKQAQSPSVRPETPQDNVTDLDAMLGAGHVNNGEKGIVFATPLNEAPSSPISGEEAKAYAAIEDEQIVNTALILFLNAVSFHEQDILAEWTLHRMPFSLTDQDGKIFEARVDGLLRHPKGTGAIIEVKPHLRNSGNKVNRIRMQESAQMAAWIAQNRPKRQAALLADLKKSRKGAPAPKAVPHRRLLISQDRQEIYLTVASFDDEYVKYLLENTQNAGCFLKMQEYGPFRVDDLNDMMLLAPYMLAFTIQGHLN